MKDKGIGLLELMLSLAIIAILLVMATRYYEVTRISQGVNEAAEMIIATYNAGNSYLQSNDFFPQRNLIPDFAKTNDVPSDFTQQNAGPWGGPITAIGDGNSTKLNVRLYKIPLGACNNLSAKVKEKLNPISDICSPYSTGSDFANYTVTFDLGD